MAENSEKIIETNSGSQLLTKIYNSNCAIKYPNNILSCLKLLNFNDNSKICPHYCPAGKIIKVYSTPSGISSIWVEITTRVLPQIGEALYVLKRNSTILKNEFPLIGFTGKLFLNFDNALFKIDDLCILKESRELRIGVKIYFKHWAKCSVSLVEIPQNGIPISEKNSKLNSNAKRNPRFQCSCHDEKSCCCSDSGSDEDSGSMSVNNESSDRETKNDPTWEKLAYENLRFQMEIGSLSESFGHQMGSQVGSYSDSQIYSDFKFGAGHELYFRNRVGSQEGTHLGSQEGTHLSSQAALIEKCQFGSIFNSDPGNHLYSLRAQMGSQGSHLGTQVKLTENCQIGSSFICDTRNQLYFQGTQMGSQRSHLGTQVKLTENCQIGSNFNSDAKDELYSQGTQMGTQRSHLGTQVKLTEYCEIGSNFYSNSENKLFCQGTQIGSQGSHLGTQVKLIKSCQSGSNFNSNVRNQLYYQGTQMGSHGSHLGTQVILTENCQIGSNFNSNVRNQLYYQGTQMGSQGSHLGTQVKLTENCQFKSNFNSDSENKFFCQGTQMGSQGSQSFVNFQKFSDKLESAFTLYENVLPNGNCVSLNGTRLGSPGAQYSFPNYYINNNQTRSNRSSWSEIELPIDQNSPIYEDPDGNLQKGSDILIKIFRLLLTQVDIFIIILTCLFIYLFFYIIIHYK